MVRLLLLSLCLAAWGAAQDLSLERLFTRPFLWGTSPSQLIWSKEGHTLAFLWNADGRRFLDLYAYHAGEKKLVRLTDLEPLKDDLNLSSEEKDDRQKHFLAPPSGLSSFHLSRNGSLAAFAYRGDLYVVPTGGGKPPFRLTRTKAAESAPQLSPDGSKIAYLRDGQLFVQDLGNGQLWQVTDVEGDAALEAFRWSPDGSRFVCVTRKSPGRKLLLPNYSGRFVTARSFSRTVAGDEPGELEFFVVSTGGGKPLPLELGAWGGRIYAGLPEWSPDSSLLLHVAVHAGMKKLGLLVADAKIGKPAVVYEDTDERWVNRGAYGWSPDSSSVFFTSERDGWAHIYTVAATGGNPRQVTRGPWEIDQEFDAYGPPKWAGEFLYYASTEEGPAERHYYRVRPDGSGKERLSKREGLNIGLVSEDGRHIAWMLADLGNPFDLYVDGERVTRSPLPEFTRQAWPETRFVSFPSRGDRKIVHAKMLLPRGYAAGRRTGKLWPAVFFIHGAGYASSVLKQWGSYNDLRFAFNCYLAQRGYVVFDLDYRGSSGYGREWRTDVYLHLGGRDLEDVLGGVDYLAGLGNIDTGRIGIWGVSYGGFMTNMAMFLSPDTFRAGVSWAAVNDWENYNAGYTAQRLTTPQANPEAYRRSSPVHFSSMLKRPLLIVHGMVDDNVLFQDAVQLSEKLIKEGKDFSQIYYPQENHGFVREETLIDAFRRTAEFLEKHLE